MQSLALLKMKQKSFPFFFPSVAFHVKALTKKTDEQKESKKKYIKTK